MSHDSNAELIAKRRRQRLYLRMAGIAVLLLVAWLKPKYDAWMNPAASDGSAEVAQKPASDSNPSESQLNGTELVTTNPAAASTSILETSAPQTGTKTKTGSTQQKSQTKDSSPTKSTNPGKSAGSTTKSTAKTDRTNPTKSGDSKKTTSKDETKEPQPGDLDLIAGTRDRFKSMAGLMYVPGSADGHRLKHVLEHAKDKTSKPVHGVFKTNKREQILKWIDQAYIAAKKGGKGVNKSDEGGRTVYTVNMGQPIGYLGGYSGKQKKNPPCRYLRLVLQNKTEVVTAYPYDRSK